MPNRILKWISIFMMIIFTTQSACAEGTPSVSSVKFSGTLEVGQILEGSYTHSEGDNESGTTFQWIKSSDKNGAYPEEISGANEQNYTLEGQELGRYISFKVTPSGGSTVGI